MYRKYCSFLIVFFSCFQVSNAQSILRVDLKWLPNQSIRFSDNEKHEVLSFEGAIFHPNKLGLPSWIHVESTSAMDSTQVKIEVVDVIYESLSLEQSQLLVKLGELSFVKEILVPEVELGFSKRQPTAIVNLIPIRLNKSSGLFERVKSFSLKISSQNSLPTKRFKNVQRSLNSSVLASGSWYKIGLAKNGVYKLDYNFLNSLGLNPRAINPKNIRIYGNGGGMLPLLNSDRREVDLVENAILVYGENDGSFDLNDYVLFYGSEQTVWKHDGVSNKYKHQLNLYSDSTYYFINVDLGPGKRISNKYSIEEPSNQNVTSFDDFAFHEVENINLIQSGKAWFGEKFDALLEYDFPFNFPDIDKSQSVNIDVSLVARSPNTSSFTVSSDQVSTSVSLNRISQDCYYCTFATQGFAKLSVIPSGDNVNVNVKYNKTTPNAVGYLDYIRIQARRNLVLSGNQMLFRDSKSIGLGNVSDFNIRNFNNSFSVWDITDPLNVANQVGTNESNVFKFRIQTDSLHQFIAFNNTGMLQPSFVEKIENQNLHGLGQVELLIVTHPKFINEANDLANFHRQEGLSTEVLTTKQVNNEFSSGANDVASIRDFVKMLYDKAPSTKELPKYLLLIGDGSYDNKRMNSSNTNYILTFQSDNSFSPTESYVSDDFFGLLDDNEGEWSGNNELLDIGIGRLPVSTNEELQGIINKIKHYYSNKSMRDWRNSIVFIADDKDNGIHLSQADQIANYVTSTYPSYNVDKIYFDSYPLVATPGGQRYPEVNEAIVKKIEKGALIVNYTGHGGEVGWAHERVLGMQEINSFANLDNLPLFFTATCEFSRFDDPSKTTAGEHVLLNSKGGGIGLFTTVRVVYSSPNFVLNDNFFKNVFQEIDGELPRMGDVFRLTKIASGGIVNNRNFTFLGDPALRLAYPENIVETAVINDNKVQEKSDTLNALQKVSISGYIKNRSGEILTSYDGLLYPTVFDKETEVKTMGNDNESPIVNYKLQRNVLYKGKVSVKNGAFTFSFILPKDIAYKFGRGKVSYYLQNGQEDGHGSFNGFIIGGTSDTISMDEKGPEIKLYLNNNKFVFGGTTNESPYLYAELEDANGINTVGNGIGHDIIANLDENSEHTIVLNDYFESDLDSYQKGKIKYPFSNLSEGSHTLKLKVWDVYNNSSSDYTEFIVAKSAGLALNHVLNYPNPFSNNTQFLFEHNQAGTNLDVEIQIFTINGTIVKTINTNISSDGFRSDPISWNGLDDFEDKIGKGVYIYKLKIKTAEGKAAEKIEKLVIIN